MNNLQIRFLRTVSLALCLILMFGLGYGETSLFGSDSRIVNAEELNESADGKTLTESGSDLAEEAALLSSLGIVNATNSGYEDAQITRSEFVGIIGRIMWNDADMTAYGEVNRIFSDVTDDDQNAGYIYAFYKSKIINGDEDKKFYPNRVITLSEAYKITAGMLGYSMIIDGTRDVKSQINDIAARAGIIINNVNNPQELTGRDVINLIYNCLERPVLSIVGIKKNGEVYTHTVEKNSDKNVLTEYLDIKKLSGVVIADSDTNIFNSIDYALDDDEIKLDSGEICHTEEEELLGKRIVAYAKDSDDEYDLIFINEEEKCKTVRINDEDIANTGSLNHISSYTADDVKKNYNISETAAFIYNGKFVGKADSADVSPELLNTDNGYIELIDNDGNNVYDVVKITQYNNIFVKSVNNTEKKFTDYYTGQVYKTEDSDKKIYIYKDGARAKSSDINVNQIISAAVSRDEKIMRLYISEEVISGKITQTENDKVKTDSGEYKISQTYKELMNSNNSKAIKVKVGLKGKFYIDRLGRISAISTVGNKYYGYLIGFADTDSFAGGGKAKIYTVNGEMAEFVLADKVKYKYDGTEKYIESEKLVKTVEPMQAVLIDTDDDDKLISLETAVQSSEPKSGVFVKNAAKVKMKYNQSVLNAKYKIGDDTMLLVVPETSTAENRYDEKYYRIAPKFSNGASYTAEVFDLNDVHDAGLVIIYSDSAVDELSIRYGLDMIVDEHIEALDENGDEIKNIMIGYCDKNKTEIPIGDTELLPDTQYAQWADLNPSAGNLRFGDIIQYNLLNSGELGSFRVLFRYDKNANYIEKWSNGSAIDENSIMADLYTAFVKVSAIAEKQIVFDCPSGGKKVSMISSSTDVYIADMTKKEIRVVDYKEIEIGDEAFLIITADGTKDIFIYRK